MKWTCLSLGLVIAASLADTAQGQTPQTAIPGVITAGAPVELVRGGYQALEGPVPTPDGGLFFSDVDASRTYKLAPDGTIVVWREGTNRSNGLFLKTDGRLLCAESGAGRIVEVAPDRTVTVLASQFAGAALRSPNDLIPDRRGGIYFTDPMPRPAPDIAPKEPGNVYYRTPAGAVVLLDDAIQRPNGISLSIDERTLFVDDTEGDHVYAFDVQADGRVTNKRPFTTLHDLERGSLGMRSRADGMGIDAEGRLYVGTSSGVQVIDRTGRYLGTIRVPAVTRNVAFGGPGHHTLYLTTLNALYRVELLSHGPEGRAK